MSDLDVLDTCARLRAKNEVNQNCMFPVRQELFISKHEYLVVKGDYMRKSKMAAREDGNARVLKRLIKLILVERKYQQMIQWIDNSIELMEMAQLEIVADLCILYEAIRLETNQLLEKHISNQLVAPSDLDMLANADDFPLWYMTLNSFSKLVLTQAFTNLIDAGKET
jgi:hypothetical protein